MKHLLHIALFLALAGCPVPPVPPAPDAGDGGPMADLCGEACANLAVLGCPEAAIGPSIESPGKSCEEVCRHAQQTKTFDMKPKCLLDAKSQDEVRACKTVRCVPK